MPPRKRKAQEEVKITDLFRMVGEQLTLQADRPNLYGYVPHEKQEIFHKNSTFGRLFIGGNRSGKTVAGVVEDIWWLTKTHPFIDVAGMYPGPIRGRVVGVDFTQGVEKILIPEFKRWMPKEYLTNGSWDDSFSKQEHTLTLTNGAVLEFMSYDQDTDKFAGTSRHFIHFDEEPPQHIFNENKMRLMDTKGKYWITMTPVEGMTWLYDDLYLPAIEGTSKNLFVLEVNNKENPHLDEEMREMILGDLPPEERKAREEGKFIEIGGRVFKTFDTKTHIIPMLSNPKVELRGWRYYLSIDSGWNNPTAVLWHAVSPDNVVITFGEHYAREMTVEEHSRVIKEREQFWGIEPYIRTGDPAMRQTKEQTGTSVQQEYARHGIYLALDGVPTGPGSVAIGVARMQQYLRIDEKRKKPRWLITENCTNLIREMKRLRWATYQSKKIAQNTNAQESIHKKDDHAPDSARYFFTLMPDLTPDEEVLNSVEFARGDGIMTYDEALVRMQRQAETDPSFKFADENSGTVWDIIESVAPSY